MIQKVEDVREELKIKIQNMEGNQERMEDCLVSIYQLKKIVELMRSHNEKIYRHNYPQMLQQRIKNARDYRINLQSSYMAMDYITREFISNKEIVEGFQFMNNNVLKSLEEQFDNLWIEMHGILTKVPIDVSLSMLTIKTMQGVDAEQALKIIETVAN